MNSVLDFPRPGVSNHPRTVHLTATGLELDDPDAEHLNTLTAQGQAVAATIQTQIEPNYHG